MQKEDGSKCTTSEENAEVFRQHFEKLYNREEAFDESILSSIPDYPFNDSLSQAPNTDCKDDMDVANRIKKAGNAFRCCRFSLLVLLPMRQKVLSINR